MIGKSDSFIKDNPCSPKLVPREDPTSNLRPVSHAEEHDPVRLPVALLRIPKAKILQRKD